MKLICVVLFFAALHAKSVIALEDNEDYWDAYKFVDECGSNPLTLCLKERALNFIERLPHNIDLGAGIRIKQIDSERTSRNHAPLELPKEAEERETIIDSIIWERVFDYLNTHKLEFRLPRETLKRMSRSMEEGRKKKQKGGGMGMMMMMMAMKAALLGALALKGIALIAFKALLVAKVALTISLVIALKKLLGQKQSTTYEVVAHPHHHEEHYDRSFSQELAYKGYKPQTSF